jgi:integrase
VGPHWCSARWLITDHGLDPHRIQTGHDARHTAATVLLILGVPTPTVMSLMGWSSAAMAGRYQHVIDKIRLEVAGQVSGLLWDSPVSPKGEGKPKKKRRKKSKKKDRDKER